MDEQIRVGITGVGGLGTDLGRGFEHVEGATVAAVADVDAGNRAAAAEALGVPVADRYESHEAMLAGADLDAVVVATPHTLHYEQVVAAIEWGLHVLCEKPLCTDVGHVRDLVERDDASERVLMVGYQRHLSPVYATARERVEAGDGPNYVTAEVTQDWIEAQRDAWRGDPDRSGGGQLYDTGSHLVDAVLWVTGLTPVAVNARMVFDDDAERVDKQAALNVEFAEGAVASLAVSGDTPRTREHLHVWDDEGAVYVEGEGWSRRELSVLDADGTVTVPGTDDWEWESKPAAFVECIREGREPPATARDALAVTAVTEAAYESARTGDTVDVDSSP
jgi:predicted dehydrogenase